MTNRKSLLLGLGLLILLVLTAGYLFWAFSTRPNKEVFQAEGMRQSHNGATDLEDATAQNGMARCVSADVDGGYIVFGPYVALPPGDYVVSFALRVDRGVADYDTSTVHLDVTSGMGQTVLVQKDVQVSSIRPTYQEVDLEFLLDEKAYLVESRAFYKGNKTLWLDQISYWKAIPSHIPLVFVLVIIVIGGLSLFKYRKSLAQSLYENWLAIVALLVMVAIFLSGYTAVIGTPDPQDVSARLYGFMAAELPTSQDYSDIISLLALAVLPYFAVLALYYWGTHKDDQHGPDQKHQSSSGLWYVFIL